MSDYSKPSRLEIERRRIGQGLSALGVVVLVYCVVPWPSWRGPPQASAEAKTKGHELFVHEWTPNDPLAKGDGLGPVFNAKSCVACHYQGGAGGGGPGAANVRAFAVEPTAQNPVGKVGIIHHSSVQPEWQESQRLVRYLFPAPAPLATGVVPRDPLIFGTINTPSLFGLGWVDRIPDRIISGRSRSESLRQLSEELAGDFEGQTPGRPHWLPDGRIGKFGWKAQFATLEEFVAAACANEIGLGTPSSKQGKPITNPNYPDQKPDLDRKQLASLVAFVDTLPKPSVRVFRSASEAEQAAHGERLFTEVGCAVCHPAKLGDVVGIYSDLLLHKVEDDQRGRGTASYYNPVPPPPEPDPRSSEPLPNEWRTPPLWGVADTAPYFHDGATATLEGAILRHAGTAKPSARAFQALTSEDREALIAFLGSLRAPDDAPAIPKNVQLLAER